MRPWPVSVYSLRKIFNIEGVGKDLTKIEYITLYTLLGTCEIFRSYTVYTLGSSSGINE